MTGVSLTDCKFQYKLLITTFAFWCLFERSELGVEKFQLRLPVGRSLALETENPKKKFFQKFKKSLEFFLSDFFAILGRPFSQNSVIRFTSNCFQYVQHYKSFCPRYLTRPQLPPVNHAVKKRGFEFLTPTHKTRGWILIIDADLDSL